MNFLGKRNGYKAVAWRAGCWGERGVRSILRGAFQWVSAHLAVDAVGGRFWQLMLAERAIQGKMTCRISHPHPFLLIFFYVPQQPSFIFIDTTSCLWA
jgi:hypothetical protein